MFMKYDQNIIGDGSSAPLVTFWPVSEPSKSEQSKDERPTAQGNYLYVMALYYNK